MDGTHARRGEDKKCSVLVGNPEKRGELARPRRRWEDNNKIDLIVLDWIQWRDGNEPVGSIK